MIHVGRDNAFAGSEVKASIIVDRARGRFWEYADVAMSPVVLFRVSASAGDAESGKRKERREAANAEDDVNVLSSAVVDSDWLRSDVTKSMFSLHLSGDFPRRCCRLLCGLFLLLRLLLLAASESRVEGDAVCREREVDPSTPLRKAQHEVSNGHLA